MKRERCRRSLFMRGTKVKGLRNEVPYIDEFSSPEMFHARFIRSQVPCGTIATVHLPEQLPTDCGIISPSDIPGKNHIKVFNHSMPILAEQEVLYHGQPLLIVYGREENVVDRLAASINVEIKPSAQEEFLPYREEQVVARRTIERGDPQTYFEQAFQIVEGEYFSDTTHGHTTDPQGAYCVPVGSGGLELFCPTQWLYHVKQTVTDATGFSPNQVTVRATQTGPPFNGRIWYPSLLAASAALVTLKTGRPARFILGSNEDILYTNIQSPVRIIHKTALNKEGNPIALDISAFVNCGAYPLLVDELKDRMSVGLAGTYTCRNARIETNVIRTTAPPMDSVFGLGLSHAFFATEAHFSRIAEILQICPSDWKSKNILKRDNSFITGGALADDSPEAGIVEQVAHNSDFRRKHAAYEIIKKRRQSFYETYIPSRGIGLAVAYQGNGFSGRGEQKGKYSVSVRLDTESTVTILSSAVSGQDYIFDVWKKTASAILGIDQSLITIEHANSEIVPDSGPSLLSRNVTIITRLIERCCQTIQKKRFRNPLPIEVKRSYRATSKTKWNEESFTGRPFSSLSWGSMVVEVEVDPIYLEVKLRGIWMVVDCGTVYNKMWVEKVLSAETMHVLDWVTSRPIIPDQPWWINRSFDIGNFTRLPVLSIDFITGAKRGEAGGIGELPANLLPAAYISAVSQATGYYIDTLPLYPARLHDFIEEAP